MLSPFSDDLALNEQGTLSDAQRMSLKSLFIARKRQMVLLVIVSLVVGVAAVYGIVRVSSEYPMTLLFLVILTLLMCGWLGYGALRLYSNKSSEAHALSSPVEKIRGTVYKFPYFRPAMPVYMHVKRAMTMQQGTPMKPGHLQIAEEKYGVLPGSLYDALPTGKEATCYYVSVGGPGYPDKVVVNFTYD